MERKDRESERGKNRTGRLMNIAHRGARNVSPENTLVAARKAYEAGADMWEFDVQLTRDEELVLVHDETLTRTTNVREVFPDRSNYRVSSFDLSEIKRLDAGSWFEESDPFGEVGQGNLTRSDLRGYSGIEVPSLREALELTKDISWRANIELKPLDSLVVQGRKIVDFVLWQLVELVVELGMVENVIVSSFAHETIRELENFNPDISGALVADEPLSHPVEYLGENNARIFNLKASAIEAQQGRENIKEISRAGSEYRVNVWTVNEVEEMKNLLANPFVDGVITDYPGRLYGVVAGII